MASEISGDREGDPHAPDRSSTEQSLESNGIAFRPEDQRDRAFYRDNARPGDGENANRIGGWPAARRHSDGPLDGNPVTNAAPDSGRRTGRPPFLARHYIVSSSHYLASEAGARMFAQGGNAIDAGVAAGLALNVIERHMSDLGGVAPIMIFRPGMAEPETIDGVGRWPASCDLATYRARYGDAMPPGMARAVTPAAVNAWLTALARYGQLTLADVAAPAVELCGGFPVYDSLARSIAENAEQLAAWPASAAVLLPLGRPPRIGELLVQRDLEDLLRHLISVERANNDRGREAAIAAARDDFYHGPIAKQIAAFAHEQDGWLTAEDLAGQRVDIAPGVKSIYRGIDVYACGPWSQGPLLPMTLNLLEGFDIAGFGAGSREFFHRYAEAFKLAAADREGFFGDPDSVTVPMAGLLEKSYAAQRRALIGDRAASGLPAPGDPWPHMGRTGRPGYRPQATALQGRTADTCYVCVMDREGNAFSATPSDPGVSAPLIPGLGILVSPRGAQLWTTAGHPSAIAPRKRPRLTPNPAMLLKDGAALMPFGCPGEDAQCQAMTQVVCNLVDFGMNVQAAIEAPRVISMSFPSTFYPHGYAPGVLYVERDVARDVRDGLAEIGHRVVDLPSLATEAARVCAIRRLDGGTLEGGADPRHESYAVGW